MKKTVKKMSVITILIVLLTNMAGCFDAREIDDQAYPMAIGFDKGDNNLLKMTLQLALPVAIAGGSGEEIPGGGGKTSSIITLEIPAIYSGLNMANTFISKQINLSHAKVIIFSEELAREGIEKYIAAVARVREFRPSMSVVVTIGSAEEYIRSVEPALETNPAKYYEMKLRAFDYTAFTADTRFFKFYHNMKSTSSQAYAVLASVGGYKNSKEISDEKSTYREKGRKAPLEGDFIAGDIPKTGDVTAEIMGLAVFDGAKMIGVLDGAETMSLLMVKGDFKYSITTLPDPLKEDNFVLLGVSQRRKPKNKVEMIDGVPNINVEISLEADILSIQSSVNYEETEKLKILEEAAEELFIKEITWYLEKSAKEYGVDVSGFGQLMKSKFITWDEWESFNWLSKYKDSTFDVKVDLIIRRPGLLLRTAPFPDSKKED